MGAKPETVSDTPHAACAGTGSLPAISGGSQLPPLDA